MYPAGIPKFKKKKNALKAKNKTKLPAETHFGLKMAQV